MPNTVWNYAEVTGPAAALNAIKATKLDFRKLMPCPHDATMHLDDLWYNWRMSHWGCKWTAYEARITDNPHTGGISASFETPWSPPYGLLAFLTREHAGVRIELDFTEEFDECIGHVVFADGRMKGEYVRPTLCKPKALRAAVAKGYLPWLNVETVLRNTKMHGGDLEALDCLPELADVVTITDVDMSFEEFVEMMVQPVGAVEVNANERKPH
jgi:hypothetical protein